MIQTTLFTAVYAKQKDSLVMEISVPILSLSTINVTDTSVEFVWTKIRVLLVYHTIFIKMKDF